MKNTLDSKPLKRPLKRPLEKRCNRCLKIKELEEFHRQSSTKDGRRAGCIFCYDNKVPPATPEQKFWYMKLTGSQLPDECWLWKGCLDGRGFGQAYFKGKPIRPHTLAWKLANGMSIPKGKVISRTCENILCCNPSHLFLRDMVKNITDNVEDLSQAIIRGQKAKASGLSSESRAKKDLSSIQSKARSRASSSANKREVKEVKEVNSERNVTKRLLNKKYGVSKSHSLFTSSKKLLY